MLDEEASEGRGDVVVESKERWMVCSSLAGGKARQLALSETGVNRGLVPWVGVAARVPHPDDEKENNEMTVGLCKLNSVYPY